MTSFDLSWRWTVLPAGTVIWGSSSWNRTVCPSGEKYSNDHWNCAATARTWMSVGVVAWTFWSAEYENRNITATMIAGMTVQMISSTLLPWIWGGSSVSVGLRR